MKEIVYNIYNLKEEEMTDLVVKVKLLVINSENKILLAYAKNDYEFPGGTHEEGETLIDTINREIHEELGIKINLKSLEPFAVSKGYYKDWPEIGRNKKIEIYYYELRLDEKPNYDNMSLTENEKEENFSLKYIDMDNIEETVLENVNINGDNRGIAKEMLNAIEIYKEIKINEKIE